MGSRPARGIASPAARQDQALIELVQAVQLSPNFALGHYNLSFVRSVVGDSHLIRLPKPCDTTHFVRHCTDEAISRYAVTRGG